MTRPEFNTQLLIQVSQGDRAALDELIPLVYEELHSKAQKLMRRDRADHTLQPTVLVHEAYMNFVDAKRLDFKNRSHFRAIAGRQMRQILAKYARDRNAKKRGGDWKRRPLHPDVAEGKPQHDYMDVSEAVQGLESLDPRLSEVADAVIFGGASLKEVGAALGVSERTVKRDWKTAKIYLYDRLSGADASGDAELRVSAP